MLSPLYVAEVSPPSVRGKMVSINQLAIVIGILVAYLSNYYLASWEENWRLMFGSGALPTILFFAFVFLVPESPRWLLANGKEQEARLVLNRLLAPSDIEREISSVQKNRSETRSEEHTSELQSLMRISYAVFCLKKNTNKITIT